MNVEYINPFVQSAQSVIKTLCNVDTKFGQISLKKSPYHASQILIMIGIVGKIKGHVCFELSRDTAMKIASSMMGGMPVTELDEMSKSAISEMGNMIMGNTSTVFAQKAIHIDITPPSMMTGSNIEVSNKLPTIVIPISIDGMGEIAVNVSIEETAE